MVATVRRAWRRAKILSQDGLIWARNTAVKIVLLSLLITFQLWLAFFMYGTFYYASMPTQLHTKPVYLDFSVCERYDGSPACPFPSSNITLVEDPSIEKLFMTGQRYTIRLEMEMPQSPVNENLGNFMVKLQTFSKGGEITAQSSKPALAKYRSPFLKLVDVVILAPFFVAGYAEEKQVVNVEMMHDFVDNAYKPTVKLGLQLRARQIEIYSSVIKIHAQFTGLRYLMFYWPLTTAAISVSINFFFLSILSMLLWRQCVGLFIDDDALEEIDGGDALAPAMSYEERRRIARQSMETERSNLFRSRPPHVTIVDPLDPPAPRGQLESAEQRPRSARSTKATTSSSGSENSETNLDAKDGEAEIETLKGEGSSSSDDPVTSFEKLEKDDVMEEREERDNVDVDEEEENEGEKEDGENIGAATSEDTERPKPHGILRHRTPVQKSAHF